MSSDRELHVEGTIRSRKWGFKMIVLFCVDKNNHQVRPIWMNRLQGNNKDRKSFLKLLERGKRVVTDN
jgi:hypothetical protein